MHNKTLINDKYWEKNSIEKKLIAVINLNNKFIQIVCQIN